MFRRLLCTTSIAALAAFGQANYGHLCESDASSRGPDAANAVVFWNDAATHSIVTVAGRPPQLSAVDAAIVHTAIFDAVNAVCGSPYTSYASTPQVQPPALADAARPLRLTMYSSVSIRDSRPTSTRSSRIF